jgi:excisionase family DNA binding protein
MGNLIIPEEADFRRWIREEIETVLKVSLDKITATEPETIYTRKEAAKLLNISLVTLTDWMKRDLPFHKQRGRVYFLRSELMEFIKSRKIDRLIA